MMKIVGITGASSGIGAALAELLAGRGHGVALVARSEDKLRDVAARCGEHALVAPADVTDRDQVRAAVQATIDGFGRVDVWVNNAGQGITRPPTALTGGDVDEMIRVNVKSVLYGMQEVLPHFQERGEGQIVNVSSMLGRLPFAVIRSAYVGSKHFMNALTALMRQELSETHPGITISLVSPGIVHTDFGLNARHGGPDSRSFGGGQSAEEVAEVIADVIERPRPDVYTAKGAQGRVAGYYAALGEDPA
jgi:NADP-dependent 3-hydroxy acid dehydrogenase YdfG